MKNLEEPSLAWIFETTFTAIDKLILIYFYDLLKDAPAQCMSLSYKKMSADLSLNRSTIRQSLKRLQQWQIISVHQIYEKHDGSRLENVYCLVQHS